jgi:phospholipase C
LRSAALIPVSSTLLLWAGAVHGAPVFKHIVIVVQENRTPDNLFGSKPSFEPGVDIATSGVNSHGRTVQLKARPLADCYDIGHDHSDFIAMLNKGADKEQLAPASGCTMPGNPEFKYVDNSSGAVQPYFDLAKAYGFANRMFQTNQGPSFPAHQFLFGGTSAPTSDSPLFAMDNMNVKKDKAGCTAGLDQTVTLIDGTGNQTNNAPIYPCFEHTTLSDLLTAANVSWRYYAPTTDGIWTAPNAIRHICAPTPSGKFFACSGTDWTNGNVVGTNPPQVLTDVASCVLPAVTWVIPSAPESDHPSSNDGSGPAWVASIVNAVGQQPTCASGENYWNDTAILITWDDWGGWYDHVPPFANNKQPHSPPAWGDGYTYGFRVPLLVVSAFTPNHTVDNATHDFGSILSFVEHNFGLGFIGSGSSIYSNYADYQAASRGDTLSAFFPLRVAKAFVPIKTTLKASYFIHSKRQQEPSDTD